MREIDLFIGRIKRLFKFKKYIIYEIKIFRETSKKNFFVLPILEKSKSKDADTKKAKLEHYNLKLLVLIFMQGRISDFNKLLFPNET
jgi:hypothetical protein